MSLAKIDGLGHDFVAPTDAGKRCAGMVLLAVKISMASRAEGKKRTKLDLKA